MHRQFFRLTGRSARRRLEPPVDVFEDEARVIIVVALPGVPPTRQVTIGRTCWWCAPRARCAFAGSRAPCGAGDSLWLFRARIAC